MKASPDRTKVVVRQLPPAITQAALAEQIDCRFGGLYNWLSFRPGKSSQKHQSYARAYIDFIKPEDVFEFAEFFNGHVFVNEKGTQFKAIVEFAPCQCVPKKLPKKDNREGTIIKDPDYLEFLEAIAKPVENLPSAEVQLDRREAERTGAAGDVPIITPLMNFVRQKRAAKNGSRRFMPNGKPIRDARTYGSPSSASSRRGSEKGRASNKMYVKRDSSKSTSSKDKSTYTIVAKQDDELDKSVATQSLSGTLGSVDTGKKILLLKGTEKEIPLVPLKPNTRVVSSTFRQNQQRETSLKTTYFEREKRPHRPHNFKSFVKDTTDVLEEKFYGNDRPSRYKDRPDRGVWAPLRRSDGSYASNEPLSLSNSQGPYKAYKHSGRKVISQDMKEYDGSLTTSEVKYFKRGVNIYNSHEKQVWVQKSSAGS